MPKARTRRSTGWRDFPDYRASSRTYPIPRTVWISLRSNGSSTLERRRRRWTSTTLDPPAKLLAPTRSASRGRRRHVAGAPGQERREGDFLRGQVELPPAAGDPVAGEVDLEV